MHDLVIENATLIDGLGTPALAGSLAVKDGRIAAIGKDLGAARNRVDAQGLTLAPGIIDLHTHYDAQLLWDSFATPSVALGVTSVVIGNCGFTIAPCRPSDRDLTLRNLTHVEGMPLEALRAGVDWDFESYPDYLRLLERKGTVPNVASFVGHSSVRTYVLREDAAKRAATKAEVARDEAAGGRGAAGRRGRLRHLDAGAAQRRERHPDALAPGRRARDAGAHRRARRSRQGRVHADQGHDHHRAVARADRGSATAAR